MTALTPARLGGTFVLALALAGCGPGEKPTGTVAGKVSYRGSPVTAGSVNFLSKTGAAAIARVDATGQFKVDGPLEAGEYRVYASAPLPEPQAPGTKATGPPKFDLPAKFRDPASSGVVVTVKAGPNDVPVEFKD